MQRSIHFASWTGGLFYIAVLALTATSLLPAPIAIAEEIAPASILADAVLNGRALTRPDYLSLLVSFAPMDVALLVKGLDSHDARLRRVSALQLGEVKAEQVDANVVFALERAAFDPEEEVGEQAIASLIRLGQIAPAALLPLLGETKPLRDIEYESASSNDRRVVHVTAADIAATALYYGRDVDLDTFVGHYIAALKAESTRGPPPTLPGRDMDHLFRETVDGDTPNLAGQAHTSEVIPGSSAYYARALAAVLRRSPTTHVPFLIELLDSQYPALRQVAFDSASRTTVGNDALNARLATIVTGRTDC
jgi:hypothetical protein